MNELRIGPEGAPKHTLAGPVVEWAWKYLTQPDGPSAGDRWRFTPEQYRFLSWWYAVDEAGRFIYRYGMLRRMKGWGKDPVAAAIACIEFVGPCRFSHWEDGEPVAAPHGAAWVQIAAVSKEQTRNTMTLFPGMLSQQALNEYEIDMGKEIIYAARGRKRIEAVTSSPRALEGGRPSIVIKNESHHWIQPNEGHAMANVIARNLAKSRDGSARALAISNAHAIGEDSDAERDWDAYRKDPAGILYDSLEAPETDLEDDESLRNGLKAARGDSEWVDVDRLMAEIRDPRTSPAMARRFYLNTIMAVEDKPFDAEKFNSLEKQGYLVPKGALITLGFDGSLSRDHTALMGTEVKTGHQWVVGYWEPRQTPSGPEIPMAEVDQTVEYAFEHWNVARMYADPSKWGTYLAAWSGKYTKEKVWSWSPTLYRKMAYALAQYRVAITAGKLTHDGAPAFKSAIGNCFKQMHHFRDDDGDPMWTIQKERPDSPMKIDAAVAAVLSWAAAQDVIAGGLPGPSVYESRGVMAL